jgi:hypothetical protein
MSGLAEYVHAAFALLGALSMIVVFGIIWAAQTSDFGTSNNDVEEERHRLHSPAHPHGQDTTKVCRSM